jgi:hypothetical protein
MQMNSANPALWRITRAYQMPWASPNISNKGNTKKEIQRKEIRKLTDQKNLFSTLTEA